MAIERVGRSVEDDFPIQDDLANLLDVMEQLPIEDVDSEGNRVRPSIPTPRPQVILDDDGLPFDDGPSASKPKKKPLKKKEATKDGGEEENKAPAKPVVRDTTDDTISAPRLKDIATDIFGEERIDVQGSGTNYTLLVHFPDFVITNSSNHKHRIRDLYVSLSVSHTGSSCSVGVSGVRSSLTLSEVNSSYSHSHLPQGGNGTLQNFCQGTSPFKTITMALNARPTEGQWELALLSLEKFVTWESLEGGPHIKMGSIASRSTNQNPNYSAEFKRWVDQIPVDTFDMREGLQANYSDRLKEFYNGVSAIRGPRANNNSADTVRQIQDNWDRQNRMRLTFRGVPLKMKIIPDEGPIEDSFIDGAVVNQYNSLLESHLINFNKRIDYEHLRYRNRGRLGKVPTFQQADVNHYKATAGKDRAASRARRKQGVVGRVNNLRKREDHRLG